MTRYVAPLLFLCAALWVFRHNLDSQGSVLMLPFLDVVPGYEGDLVAQGQLTWKILVGLGGGLLAARVGQHLRDRRAGDDEEDEA